MTEHPFPTLDEAAGRLEVLPDGYRHRHGFSIYTFRADSRVGSWFSLQSGGSWSRVIFHPEESTITLEHRPHTDAPLEVIASHLPPAQAMEKWPEKRSPKARDLIERALGLEV